MCLVPALRQQSHMELSMAEASLELSRALSKQKEKTNKKS